MTHPLDPLTATEISESSRLIKELKLNKNGWIFNSIILIEPPKSELAPLLLLNNKNSLQEITKSFPRKSFVLLIEKKTGIVYEAVVNLTSKIIEEFNTAKSGEQPTLTPEDCFEAEKIAKEDASVQGKCRSLGLNDMNLITADPW